ncbi:hypothetical protein N8J89_12720 [Crossiella sp. CA-258035]|uniref:hypothetical protein n=1 Tax=Crossiella sp. CA-258035 TaxID=2981138 RepID=UPI0024BD04DD|nr:hypothetical protein [Crossiella sp. CA-258035]WHT21883.1 hypothetical protein N8J89_12720 [Crossiella sp. CA-258035]
MNLDDHLRRHADEQTQAARWHIEREASEVAAHAHIAGLVSDFARRSRELGKPSIPQYDTAVYEGWTYETYRLSTVGSWRATSTLAATPTVLRRVWELDLVKSDSDGTTTERVYVSVAGDHLLSPVRTSDVIGQRRWWFRTRIKAPFQPVGRYLCGVDYREAMPHQWSAATLRDELGKAMARSLTN